jgi:hypothetical protein
MSNEEAIHTDEEVMSNVVWDVGTTRDWSNNLYAAAYEHVAGLVTEDGFIAESFPFVSGGVDTEAAFEVLLDKIQGALSEDSEESIAEITNVVFLAFMAGAWVASAQDSPYGYNISLTKEQIAQVVQTWVAESLN